MKRISFTKLREMGNWVIFPSVAIDFCKSIFTNEIISFTLDFMWLNRRIGIIFLKKGGK